MSLLLLRSNYAKLWKNISLLYFIAFNSVLWGKTLKETSVYSFSDKKITQTRKLSKLFAVSFNLLSYSIGSLFCNYIFQSQKLILSFSEKFFVLNFIYISLCQVLLFTNFSRATVEMILFICCFLTYYFLGNARS